MINQGKKIRTKSVIGIIGVILGFEDLIAEVVKGLLFVLDKQEFLVIEVHHQSDYIKYLLRVDKFPTFRTPVFAIVLRYVNFEIPWNF